jgi:hypothetical protein
VTFYLQKVFPVGIDGRGRGGVGTLFKGREGDEGTRGVFGVVEGSCRSYTTEGLRVGLPGR